MASEASVVVSKRWGEMLEVPATIKLIRKDGRLGAVDPDTHKPTQEIVAEVLVDGEMIMDCVLGKSWRLWAEELFSANVH